MDECTDKYVMFYASIASTTLWLLSEVLGMSKCKSNSVFEFVLNGFCYEISVKRHEEESEPLID